MNPIILGRIPCDLAFAWNPTTKQTNKETNKLFDTEGRLVAAGGESREWVKWLKAVKRFELLLTSKLQECGYSVVTRLTKLYYPFESCQGVRS